MQNPEWQMILEEKPVGEIGKTGADVALLWGDRQIPKDSRTYRLGTDRLVFAAHKSNPLQTLAINQAAQLIRGSYGTWTDALNHQCPGCTITAPFDTAAVEAWQYTAGTDITVEVAGLALNVVASPAGRVWLAPSARTLAEILTNNPAAVGWLPARWMNENLKEIKLEGIDPSLQTIPVLAVTPGIPGPAAGKFIQCMQSSFGN